MTCAHDFSYTALDGSPQSLAAYRGQPLLLVNVASRCGFTAQYTELEALWQRHRAAGLVVVGFPCNQFGGQEPGDAAQIAEFCRLDYGVSFPLAARIEVNGTAAEPLWAWLKSQRRGFLGTAAIKWNFTKFLVGRDGQVRRRYGSTTKPQALEADILAALQG
jgi:glutathione peroxidase